MGGRGSSSATAIYTKKEKAAVRKMNRLGDKYQAASDNARELWKKSRYDDKFVKEMRVADKVEKNLLKEWRAAEREVATIRTKRKRRKLD